MVLRKFCLCATGRLLATNHSRASVPGSFAATAASAAATAATAATAAAAVAVAAAASAATAATAATVPLAVRELRRLVVVIRRYKAAYRAAASRMADPAMHPSSFADNEDFVLYGGLKSMREKWVSGRRRTLHAPVQTVSHYISVFVPAP